VAFSKSRMWWVVWVCVCPWFIHALNCSNYVLTNFLFGLCRYVWIIDLLITHFNPHRETPSRTSTPELLWTKKRAPSPYRFVVFIWGSHLSLSRNLGCVTCNVFPKFLHKLNKIIYNFSNFKKILSKIISRIFQEYLFEKMTK
jgi:hypothetical protein